MTFEERMSYLKKVGMVDIEAAAVVADWKAEREKLIEMLDLCESQLRRAWLFKGYIKGPLNEQFTEMVLNHACAVLEEVKNNRRG